MMHQNIKTNTTAKLATINRQKWL